MVSGTDSRVSDRVCCRAQPRRRAVEGRLEIPRVPHQRRQPQRQQPIRGRCGHQQAARRPCPVLRGRPENLRLAALPFRKEVVYDAPELGGLSEWRQTERQLQRLKTSPQSVWKLAGAGAVGSQSLVGIPVVARLRDHEALRHVSRIWPFEVHVPNARAGSPAVVHAEIWPTIVPFADEPGSCRDEQQVRAVVRHWREQDRAGHLANLFAAAPDNGPVLREEGWVLGAPAPGTHITVPPRPPRERAPRSGPAASSAVTTIKPAASITRQPCLCGCGNFPRGKRSRFMPGHDQRINPATGRRFNAN